MGEYIMIIGHFHHNDIFMTKTWTTRIQLVFAVLFNFAGESHWGLKKTKTLIYTRKQQTEAFW